MKDNNCFYIVVKSSSIPGLEKLVQAYLRSNWELVGSLVFLDGMYMRELVYKGE